VCYSVHIGVPIFVCLVQYVAVCCSVLQCVAVCYSVHIGVAIFVCLRVSCAVCRIALQCVAVCYSVLRCVTVCDMIYYPPHIRGLILVCLVQCVAVCCSVLQCVTWLIVCYILEVWSSWVFCSVLQYVAVCCSVLQYRTCRITFCMCSSVLQCVTWLIVDAFPSAVCCNLWHVMTHYLQHTATHCSILQHIASRITFCILEVSSSKRATMACRNSQKSRPESPYATFLHATFSSECILENFYFVHIRKSQGYRRLIYLVYMSYISWYMCYIVGCMARWLLRYRRPIYVI